MNWTLLQEKQLQTKEEALVRKEEQRQELEALNRRRIAEREKAIRLVGERDVAHAADEEDELSRDNGPITQACGERSDAPKKKTTRNPQGSVDVGRGRRKETPTADEAHEKVPSATSRNKRRVIQDDDDDFCDDDDATCGTPAILSTTKKVAKSAAENLPPSNNNKQVCFYHTWHPVCPSQWQI